MEFLRNTDSARLQKFLFSVLNNHFTGTGKQSNEIVLSWPGAVRGRPRVTHKFYKIPRQPKSGSHPKTCHRWVKAQADILEARMALYSKEQVLEILECLAERYGLIIINPDKIRLSVHDCIALRDHIQTSTTECIGSDKV